jgi:hypothetical protein
MPSPTFEIFETICDELSSVGETYITSKSFSPSIIQKLQRTYGNVSPEESIRKCLKALSDHFLRRGARLPFSFNRETLFFRTANEQFVNFVALAKSIRGEGDESKAFEVAAATRLFSMITGDVRRIGWPREEFSEVAEFRAYLQGLGFEDYAVETNDKDCGFDVIWYPPLGAVPLRAMISLQCKNSSVDFDDASASVARARRTLARHSVLRAPEVTLFYVLFNDYIDELAFRKYTGWTFVPLGITDLIASRRIAKLFLMN